MFDPNFHSCGTVEPYGFAELRHPGPNFFIAGMTGCGRAGLPAQHRPGAGAHV